MNDIANTWVYLAKNPLLWLTMTVVLYYVFTVIHKRLGSPVLLAPLIPTAITMITVLAITDTPYNAYFDGAQFIHFLLGPATVALAIPLYKNVKVLKSLFAPICVALLIGSITGVCSAVLLGKSVGLPESVLVSLAPKSITTPIAMAVAEQQGGSASLAAMFVAFTGILGVLFARQLLALFRMNDPSVQGFGFGLAMHGLGTAVALQMNERAGAFAGLGMALNAVITAAMMPILITWLL